jgi:hypothetical protein
MSTVPRPEPRTIPSDATLVWLASERASPLFRTLDRARAFGPLVVLLAVLPVVLAAFGPQVTAEGAAWGLRALDLTGAEMPPEALPEVQAVVPAELVRPAALGLSALLMRVVNPAAAMSASFASLLGGAALIAVVWGLARALSGRRFAFWVVAASAFHPTLVALLRFPAPVTFGLACGAAAFWASLNLDGRAARAVAAWVGAFAAVVAGLLLIGPPALAVPAVIFADALLSLVLPSRSAAARPGARAVVSPGMVAVRRAAAAVAGTATWLGIGRVLSGAPAGSYAGAAVASVLSPAADGSVAEAAVVGPLWGLAAIGVGRLLRVVHRRAVARSPRPVPRMVLVWLFAAGAAVLWAGAPAEDEFDPAGRYATALAGLSLLFAAAYAIEEASRRSVSGAWVLLAVALPLAVRLGTYMATIRADGPAAWIGLATSAVVLMWFATKALPAILPLPGLRRGVLMAAILTAVALDAADGLGLLLRDRPADDSYGRLTAQLRAAGPADAVVLLADAPPPDLVFAVRASYPDADLDIAPSLEEVARKFAEAKSRQVVVAWGMKRPAGAASEDVLRPIGEPMLFEDREVLLYTGPGAADGKAPQSAAETRPLTRENSAREDGLTRPEAVTTFRPPRG